MAALSGGQYLAHQRDIQQNRGPHGPRQHRQAVRSGQSGTQRPGGQPAPRVCKGVPAHTWDRVHSHHSIHAGTQRIEVQQHRRTLARGGLCQSTGEGRGPCTTRAREHSDGAGAARRTVRCIREYLDQPGLRRGELHNVGGSCCQGASEESVASRRTGDYVYVATTWRTLIGDTFGCVAADQHHRGGGPATQCAGRLMSHVERGARSGGKPEQVVEQGVVSGDEEGRRGGHVLDSPGWGRKGSPAVRRLGMGGETRGLWTGSGRWSRRARPPGGGSAPVVSTGSTTRRGA